MSKARSFAGGWPSNDGDEHIPAPWNASAWDLSNVSGPRYIPASALLSCVLLSLLLMSGICAGQTNGIIGTVQGVRQLKPDQAESRLPVQLKGVITFFDDALFSRFLQDETAGIYLLPTNMPALNPGDLVEVTGRSSQGEYAPVVEVLKVDVLGKAPLPEAKPTSFEQLASGSLDSQFVEIGGVVRSVRFDSNSLHYAISLATGGGRLEIFAKKIPTSVADLVDATVRVRGVCSTLFNRRRQLFAIRLMVPRPEDLIIERAAATDPYAIPAHDIGSLLQFSPEGSFGHRVKVTGTVILQHPGEFLFLQGGIYGLQVLTTQTEPLGIGDRVEVLGFPRQGDYSPLLEDAVYRKIESGPPPHAQEINVDAALSGTFDARLVRIQAKLLDRAHQSREQFLVLESNGFIFHAYLEKGGGQDGFEQLRNGSLLGVKGVCLIEPGEWRAGEEWRARSFRLRLRSEADIEVIKQPPWWTLRKLLWMVALLLMGVLCALAWAGGLRRKVQQQTQIIRNQMIVDAALKERYEDLFENANDMVFTHDLSGSITSINRAGERLLQRKRAEVLNTPLINLVVESERAAARHWLELVSRGAELQTAEWDFINGAGQKVKVEISSRLVETAGKASEIESVARDVTERRRLERELLEISNREQRRIGHDLHDGVCQQLAGIAYRVDMLGDLLHEEKRPEAGEADKIASLISEATVQARSVARGLFPVRLAENGLLAALEELAEGAPNRYPIECTFECKPPPPVIVDNDKALHLYYIAQEALVNAVKHGKATNVQIMIEKTGERHCLSVKDDGAGFQPPGPNHAGMGIRIMHYRAKVIGATLEVQSALSKGTCVSCFFADDAA